MIKKPHTFVLKTVLIGFTVYGWGVEMTLILWPRQKSAGRVWTEENEMKRKKKRGKSRRKNVISWPNDHFARANMKLFLLLHIPWPFADKSYELTPISFYGAICLLISSGHVN